MKFLIIFVVALVAMVCGQQHQGNLINQTQWRQCIQDAKIEQEDVNRFKNRDFSNTRDTTQCFTNCLFDKMGIVNPTGEIVEAKLTQLLSQNIPSDQLTPKIQACRGQARGQNKCENAHKFYVCLLNSTGNTDLFRFAEMN